MDGFRYCNGVVCIIIINVPSRFSDTRGWVGRAYIFEQKLCNNRSAACWGNSGLLHLSSNQASYQKYRNSPFLPNRPCRMKSSLELGLDMFTSRFPPPPRPLKPIDEPPSIGPPSDLPFNGPNSWTMVCGTWATCPRELRHFHHLRESSTTSSISPLKRKDEISA